MSAQSWRFTVLAFVVFVVGQPVYGAPPAGFQNQVFVSGLDLPTALAFTPDGRMLVCERKGTIKIVQPGASQADITPLLKLTNINTAQGERALIGLTLDPDFAINGYYYVFYTAATPLRDRVSRFTASGDVTVANSEVVVWQDSADAGTNHHGGTVAFGGDGKLYISVGDHFDQTSGSAHVSQRLDSYHGKILRINSDGSTPTDNPFYDGTGPNLDAIWARGLRNPFRFSFDPNNGRLYIGDVGGNNVTTSIEELNLGIRGANYGWPICEGSCTTTGMTNPIFSYRHGGRDASITAGLVYRATTFPSTYQGSFFYADYAQKWIKRLTMDATGNVTGSVNFEPEDGTLDGPYGSIVDLKTGPDGALYYVDIGSGTVHQISYLAVNHPPVINSVSAGPTSGLGPVLDVAFSSTASDVDNDPLTYTWDFGDGVTAASANPSHTYTKKGKFAARLTVSDGKSQIYSNLIYITVGKPPSVTITAPIPDKTFVAGEVISFAGTASDDGVLTDSNYSWTVIFHHESHVHPGAGPFSGARGGTFTIPTTGHDFSGNTSFELILTVTDADGLQGSASTFIFPKKVNLNFNSSPTGLALSFDQETNVATPFTRDTLVGFSHTIGAAIQQTLGGALYDFISWSDGGSAKHVINAPAASTSYVAQYQSNTTPFSYSTAITIGDNAAASPYPASVNVSGMSGTISKVSVTLNGLTHTYPADLDVMLVSPGGQKVMLMSDAGGGTDVSGITLTFDAAASAAVPTTALATGGTYLPANYDTTTDAFPAPAPASPYSTVLTAFNGSSPNGDWKLFVRDDAGTDLGALSGYTLTITTQ